MRGYLSIFALAGAALAAASGTPAFAQQTDLSTKETRALMHAYAKCVVDRQGGKAAEALLKNVDNATMLRQYRMLIIGDCLARQTRASAKMSFSGDLYRYALADALVNRELAQLSLSDLSAVPRLAHREPGEAPRQVTPGGKKLGKRKFEEALKDHRESVAWSFLSRFGECVVRQDSAGAKALLLTVPDSPDEAARFGGLRASLGACMPEGHSLAFGKTALRGSIAIGYYRLADAAGVSATRQARN